MSTKASGIVGAYAAITNAGIMGWQNHDRIAIVTNLFPPKDRKHTFWSKSSPDPENLPQWPRCSFFGIFDGHKGVRCAEFLRDNVHRYITAQQCFPSDPKKAIYDGLLQADKDYINLVTSSGQISDTSGSSANMALFVDDVCYVANVGDSRALLAMNIDIVSLNEKHTPNLPREVTRVSLAGGQIER